MQIQARGVAQAAGPTRTLCSLPDVLLEMRSSPPSGAAVIAELMSFWKHSGSTPPSSLSLCPGVCGPDEVEPEEDEEDGLEPDGPLRRLSRSVKWGARHALISLTIFGTVSATAPRTSAAVKSLRSLRLARSPASAVTWPRVLLNIWLLAMAASGLAEASLM